MTPTQELRATNREQLFGTQPHDIEPRPIAITVPHREIHVLSCEVDVMQSRRNAQIDAGMRFGKSPKTMHQPFGAQSLAKC